MFTNVNSKFVYYAKLTLSNTWGGIMRGILYPILARFA